MPDDIIDLDAEDEPLQRRALPSGLDPWTLSTFSVSEWRRHSYQQEIEDHGVDITCIIPDCGKVRRVHPLIAWHTKYCSKEHRELGFRLRKKGVELPVDQVPWKPWDWRKR